MPGRYCVVSDCKSRWIKKEKGVIFFSVPSDICEGWRRVINHVDPTWVPKKATRICSKHFTRDDIYGRKLRKGAIPTLNPNRALEGMCKKLNFLYKFYKT